MAKSGEVYVRMVDDFGTQSASINAEMPGWPNVLDLLQFGVICVDPVGVVSFINRFASEIISNADGLAIDRGRLVAATAAETASLTKLIAEATEFHENGETGSMRAMQVSRTSTSRPYLVFVTSVSESASQRRGAVVSCYEPDRELDTDGDTLIQLYGLTHAETALALELLRGHRLDQVAKRLSLSMNTVRSHLKRVFQKTETHSQASLIRLLLTGSSMVRSKNGAMAATTVRGSLDHKFGVQDSPQ